jgi:hypothetical protein
MLEIEGAVSGGEIGDGMFQVKVGYACPYCSKQHRQVVRGAGTAVTGVELKSKCQRGFLKVVPYRAE